MLFWIQLLILFFFGAFVGGQLNRGIYRLAIFNKRLISPWSSAPDKAGPRQWVDRIPIFGWLALKREELVHGKWFWIRPMSIEIVVALGFPTQYYWEVHEGLVPIGFATSKTVLIANCTSHLILFCLMVVASFIDIDEKTIPDEITVYGALVGLSLAAILPFSLLPNPTPPTTVVPLLAAIPWPTWLNGTWGLIAGLACFLGWYYAILPKIWRTKDGIVKAVRLLVASLLRYAITPLTCTLALLGCAAIATVWKLFPLVSWQGLLTSLFGMALGTGLVWAVRIIGTLALRREAMGFGDVTLMAMIGTFVGWQPALVVFFLAPLTGVFLAIGQWVLTGRKDIPYGPFLCFGTWFLIEFWAILWPNVQEIFSMEISVLLLILFCLLLMHGMLTLWRFIADIIWK